MTEFYLVNMYSLFPCFLHYIQSVWLADRGVAFLRPIPHRLAYGGRSVLATCQSHLDKNMTRAMIKGVFRRHEKGVYILSTSLVSV